ncbi:MAG: sodium:proton exchanger [Betaproteobacteria bacterium RIFCSPLOWO2_12_FULL_62_58]|nr:MAG: sodium:proton exchanger [Betaproteobacteria bacterium RIFCSPLOWO2_12_FULL_62_58]
MTGQTLAEILLLLGLAVLIVTVFQRLGIPSSLGYLLVGVLLGPYTVGPVIDSQHIRVAAELGIVFLLFTIGLNFSLPQIYALRHLVLGLGTGQVLLTTVIVGMAAWLAGLPPAAAFVVGAVFAQSSTTIISKQLAEQGEEQSQHGRLALAMSVFQDVTAVPFVVVIPVLATATAGSLVLPLSWALAKALLAFALVLFAGRWMLRPLFHEIAARRSAELFTLTVLLVSLMSAWATHSLGLSMAFGAFLAGMMLGETEFRHQIDSAIRPFRDVLLGLFFVTIGMLLDPASLPRIWHWALIGAAVLLTIKGALVALIVRRAGVDTANAWRTGIVLAVGGEFGFALLAIALDAQVIAAQVAQIVLTAVLLSMILGPFLIRFNHRIAARIAGARGGLSHSVPVAGVPAPTGLRNHVIICGYGRIGQNVGRFLEEEQIPYVALDLDPVRVRDAHTAGEPVYYGDAAERDILEAVGLGSARLVVVSHDDVGVALKVLHHVRALRPDLPVMVRTRDESHVDALREAGATEVVPETLEAGMMIVSHALLLLDVPLSRVVRRMRDSRVGRYRLMREFFRGGDSPVAEEGDATIDRLCPVSLGPGAYAAGRSIGELGLDRDHVLVTAVVRGGKRQLAPDPETRLNEGDVVVLFGAPEELRRAESRLLG